MSLLPILVVATIWFSIVKGKEPYVVFETLDNRGREFVVGFLGQTSSMNPDVNLTLYLTSEKQTRATVVADGFKKELLLKPRMVDAVFLPRNLVMMGGKERKGIVVTADEELAVYGLNQVGSSTDAFLALPTELEGMEYFVASYKSYRGRYSTFSVIAVSDNTRVTVQPSARYKWNSPSKGEVTKKAGSKVKLKLNRLESYQFSAINNDGDMTGTRIVSNKPITLLSGHECATVPVGVNYCDYLIEQVPPVNRWGTEFATVPLATRTNGDVFRVVAWKDGTVVQVNGRPYTTKALNSGKFLEIPLSSTSYNHIVSNKPVMLIQYCKGTTADGRTTDPFMMLVPPTNQYALSYTISTPPPAPVNFTNYVNLIVPRTGIDGMRLDERRLPETLVWHPVPQSNLSATTIPISSGSHSLRHLSRITPFAVLVYGYAKSDSYGYPGGLRLADLRICYLSDGEPGDGRDNDCDERIDEEVYNSIDDDGDGMVDEDLATPPPVLSQPDNQTRSTCSNETDPVRPTVIYISPNCTPENLTFADYATRRGCLRVLNRTWTLSDGCGNVVRVWHTISILDRAKPTMRSFPVNVDGALCSGLSDLDVVGSPSVADNCDLNPTATYVDDFDGCIVRRRWDVVDSCGNAAPSRVQTIRVRVRRPHIPPPVDETLVCKDLNSLADPFAAVPKEQFICDVSRKFRIRVTHMDVRRVETECDVTLTRLWNVTVACNDNLIFFQTIVVKKRDRAIDVSFPKDVAVPCDDVFNLAVTGRPKVGQNCAQPITITHEDFNSSCNVRRHWFVLNECGDTLAEHVQTIYLSYNYSYSGETTDVLLYCKQSLPALAPGVFSRLRVCGPLRVKGPDFNVSHRLVGGNSCRREVRRLVVVTDSCRELKRSERALFLIDDKPPSVFMPSFSARSVSCREAANFTLVGRARAADDCSSVQSITHRNRIRGNQLVRRWAAEDECGNESPVKIQRLTLVEAEPVIDVPKNATLLCPDSIHPNQTGWAILSRDVSESCFQLDKSIPETILSFEDKIELDGCPKIIRRVWSATDFLGHHVTASQFIFQEKPCFPSSPLAADRIDNDCDKQIDEEIRNFVDDDGDGLVDEDLAYEPVKLQHWPGSINASDCNFDTSVQRLGIPTVEYVTEECKPVNFNKTDTWETRNCSWDLTRLWTATDSCGNVDRNIQEFHLRDRSGPVIEFKNPSGRVSCHALSRENRFRYVHIWDKCNSTVEEVAHSDFYFSGEDVGCGVQRRWRAHDACGNPSLAEQMFLIAVPERQVRFPANQTVECDHSSHPNSTGWASVVSRTVCTSDVVIKDVVNYEDIIYSESHCRTVIRRHWSIRDGCGGRTAANDQYITVIHHRNSRVDFPSNTSVSSCKDLANLQKTGRPTVKRNCTELDTKYQDHIDGCRVIRQWTVSDPCTGEHFKAAQNIVVEFDEYELDVPASLTVACDAEVSAPSYVGPVPFTQQCIHRGDILTVSWLGVEIEDREIQFNSCRKVVRRTIRGRDSCRSRTYEQVITYSDKDPPTFLELPDAVATCREAVDGLLPAPRIEDSCSKWEVKHVDQLSGTSLRRTWQAEDACGNAAMPRDQLIRLRSHAPRIAVPSNTTVSCGEDPTLNVTGGAAGIKHDIQPECFDLGFQPSTLTYTDHVEVEGCPGLLRRRWVLRSDFGHQIEADQWIHIDSPPCETSPMVPFDSIDNDCDERIDEEVRNFIDDDGDGLTDEDLASEPVKLKQSSDSDSSARVDCDFDTSVQRLGIPTVEYVTEECKPVKFNKTDTWETRNCSWDLTRLWTATDSCGNIDRHTQEFRIKDSSGPTIDFKNLSGKVDCHSLSRENRFRYVHIWDKCNSTVEEVAHSDFYFSGEDVGCGVQRRWRAHDACGNPSLAEQMFLIAVPERQVRFPANQTVECDHSSHPNSTGWASVVSRTVCTSDVVIKDVVNYEDIIYSESHCRTVIRRHWSIRDGCGGRTAANDQYITVIHHRNSRVDFPSNTSVSSCKDLANLQKTGRPTVKRNCTELDTKYHDLIDGCRVIRQWTVSDPCTGEHFKAAQNIVVEFDEYELGVPASLTVACDAEVSAPSYVGPVPFTQQCIHRGGILTVSWLGVETEDREIQFNSCRKVVRRTIRARDSCRSRTYEQVITYSDKDPPTFLELPDAVATCREAVNGLLPAPRIEDSCSKWEVKHVDQLSGTSLRRTWQAEDACRNAAMPRDQLVRLRSHAPRIAIPSNTTVSCGEDPTLNVTGGAAEIKHDIQPECIDLGFQPSTLRYTDHVEVDGCPGLLRRRWVLRSDFGHQIEADQWIHIDSPPCETSPMVPFDSIDNDCDERIDEEVRNFVDDDGDGLTDEDLAFEPVKLKQSSDSDSSAGVDCDFDTSVQRLGIPTVEYVTEQCKPVNFNKTDTWETRNCSWDLTRLWTATDSCGNIDRKIQEFHIKDSSGPTIDFKNPSGKVDCHALTGENRFRYVHIWDKCNSTVEEVAHSDFYFSGEDVGCGVQRRWRAHDACGNPSFAEQTFLIAVPERQVRFPANQTVECDHSSHPNSTGWASVVSRTVCTTDVVVKDVVNYEDVIYSESHCRTVIRRHWSIGDGCGGNVMANDQYITVIHHRSPHVDFPSNTAVSSCKELREVHVTGTPSVTSNCTHLDIEYADDINGCHVLRQWIVSDPCTGKEYKKLQIILLEFDEYVLDIAPSLTVACNATVEAPSYVGPVPLVQQCIHGDGILTVAWLGVELKDHEIQSNSCRKIVQRTIVGRDSCRNYSYEQTITYLDRDPPALLLTSDTVVATCREVRAERPFSAEAKDECSKVTLDHVDQLYGTSSVRRTWRASDVCGNEAMPQDHLLQLRSDRPQIEVPPNMTIPCGESASLNATGGAARIKQDIQPECFELGVQPSVLTHVDESRVDGCPGLLRRHWVLKTDLGHRIEADQWIHIDAPPCETSAMVPADSKDNDCDGRTDEESRNFLDDDNDGLIDEDLASIPPTIIVPPVSPVVACRDVGSLSAGTSGIVSVIGGCSPLLTYEDVIPPRAGRCAWVVLRLWRAVDACNNTANATQEIRIRDVTPPVLQIPPPPSSGLRCDELVTQGTTNLREDLAFDECSDNVTVMRQDKIASSCTVLQNWSAVDGCGNVSPTFTVSTNLLMEAPAVRFPVDSTLKCGAQRIIPAITGEPVVAEKSVCGSEHRLSYAMTYSDSNDTSKDCWIRVVRTWLVEDECGRRTSGIQRINIRRRRRPEIIFPLQHVRVDCFGAENVTLTGRPSVFQNCTPVTMSYSDTVTNCSIVRRWSVFDDCGELIAEREQNIQIDYYSLWVNTEPKSIDIDCRQRFPEHIGSLNPPRTLICGPLTIAGPYFDVEDVPDLSSSSCAHTTIRRITARDSCHAIETFYQKITRFDRTPPIVSLPLSAKCECNQTKDMVVVGEPTVVDDCSNVTVSYTDTLNGHLMLRQWSAEDSCGNRAEPKIQQIELLDNPPEVDFPPDANIYCDQSPLPNVTGMPKIMRDVSDDCLALGCQSATLSFTDEHVDNRCPTVLTRTWQVRSFIPGNELRRNQTIAMMNLPTKEPCIPAAGSPADRIDNDCDGRVDEEARNFIDDDGDGLVDEDLATMVPRMLLPSSVVLECDDSENVQSFRPKALPSMRPSFRDVEKNCSNMTVDFYDNGGGDDRKKCSLLFHRFWTAKDGCGNVVNSSQTIEIRDQVKPILLRPPDSSPVQCDDLRADVLVTPSEDFVSDNCANVSSLIVRRRDALLDSCFVRRQWTAEDQCGNVALPLSQVVPLQLTDSPSIRFPHDVTLECVSDVRPAVTGRPVINSPVVCGAFRRGFNITYIDTPALSDSCHRTIRRLWTITDECGESVRTHAQMITTVKVRQPRIRFPPKKVSVKCSNANESGEPTVTNNCTSVSILVEDEVAKCDVVRRWKVVDACGREVGRRRQTVSLEYDIVTAAAEKLADETTIGCKQPLPTLSAIPRQTITCGLVNVTGPNVVLKVLSQIEEGGCRETIVRSFSLSDSCGASATALQRISRVDRDPPTITHYPPSDIEVPCNEVTQFRSVGKLRAEDGCNAVYTSYKDSQNGSLLLRRWRVTDECGNDASSYTQRIRLLFNQPVVSFPAVREIACTDSARPDFTGRPMVTSDETEACQRLGIQKLNISYRDELTGSGCPARIVRTWKVDILGQAASGQQVIMLKENPNAYCRPLPSPRLGFMRPVGVTEVGTTVAFYCRRGFRLTGSRLRTCQKSLEWSGTQPVCGSVYCGDPGRVENGQFAGAHYTYGRHVVLQCNAGYSPTGDKIRYCQSSGRWTSGSYSCKAVECPRMNCPPDGWCSSYERSFGSIVKFRCNNGYQLSGSRERVCQVDSTWSGVTATCDRKGCGRTFNSPSGKFSSPSYPRFYGNDAHCVWRIETSASATLVFDQFDTEKDRDVLTIRNGISRSSTAVARLSGKGRPLPLTSSSGFYLTFQTNERKAGLGFAAKFFEASPCGGVVEGAHGIIKSPNYPQRYPRGVDCYWTIVAPHDNMRLSFLDFGVSMSDYCIIRDGVTDDSKVLRRLKGSRSYIRGSVVTLPSAVSWIHFHSDAFGSDRGFRAVFSEGSSCRDILRKGQSRGSGVYWIFSDQGPQPFQVYCDMVSRGGGWTLVARVSNSDDRSWSKPKHSWWSHQLDSVGQTLLPESRGDMVSSAFWMVGGQHVRLSRSSDSATLAYSTARCLNELSLRAVSSACAEGRSPLSVCKMSGRWDGLCRIGEMTACESTLGLTIGCSGDTNAVYVGKTALDGADFQVQDREILKVPLDYDINVWVR